MLLCGRSIFLQTCLLLLISFGTCQNYESDYAAEDDGDNAEVQEEPSHHPDYSKYYLSDTSSPLIASAALSAKSDSTGFVAPYDFPSFFSPSLEFGASNTEEKKATIKNPFVEGEKQALGFINIKEEFPQFHSSASTMKDFFDESQKKKEKVKQSKTNDSPYDSKPGPSYISHSLPAKYADSSSYSSPSSEAKNLKNKKSSKDATEQASSGLDSYKIPDYSIDYSASPGKYADYNSGKSSSSVSQYPQASGHQEKVTSSPTPTPYQKYSFQPVTDYALPSKYLSTLISTAAPYNPTYNKVVSTENTPALEFQGSENIPKHLQGKGCKKIQKHIKSQDGTSTQDAMNCYVCEDPKTSSKFTQCAYGDVAEPSASNNKEFKIEDYYPSQKDVESYRQKRYSGEDYNTDPYEYFKKRTESEFPKQDEAETYESEDFLYKPDDYYGGNEKSSSEITSEQIAKNPANCVKEDRDGMTCTVCKDSAGGGNYEQCSYASDPKEQKYAYVTEKKYNSNDEPASTVQKPVVEKKSSYSSPKDTKSKESPENKSYDKPYNSKSFDSKPYDSKSYDSKSFDSKPYNSKPYDSKSYDKKQHDNKPYDSKTYDSKPYDSKSYDKKQHDNKPYDSKTYDSKSYDKKQHDNKPYDSKTYDSKTYDSKPYDSKSYGNQPSKKVADDKYEIPQHFAESTEKEKKTGGKGLEPSLYGGIDSAESSESANTKSPSYLGDIHDEYHFNLFPDYSNQETKQSEALQTPETSKKDVAEVLLEFSKKDRSSCKKAEKNGMTCYLCVDQKGIQHEECMYVSESKPVATHVAYHELQQIKSPKKTVDQLELSPSVAESNPVPETTKLKYQQLFEKATSPLPFLLEAAASEEKEVKVPYKSKSKSKYRKKNYKKGKKSKAREPKSSASEIDSEKLKDEDEPPIKFVIGDEEGLYSAETKPVYSKSLGVKLPRYMIEKSEFEKEFDEFSGEH